MNWNLIKEKYPKAYKEGQDWWVAHAEIYEPAFLFNVGNRFLYDLFDEQGIVIGIEVLYYDGFWFTPTITVMWDTDTNMKIGSQSRTEAEEQAFLKAFEILEDKL